MTRIKLQRWRPWRGAARLATASLTLTVAGGVFGCLDRPIAANEPHTTSTVVERLSQSAVDKIDILLAIDNSKSMADKQNILAEAVPDLVKGLVNPRCVDPKGGPMTYAPSNPKEACPDGLKREFNPVLDIHIGIISSSLGGYGGDICDPDKDGPSNVDMGHLLARSDPGDRTEPRTSMHPEIKHPIVEIKEKTYQGKGYLAWDPDQKIDGAEGVADPKDGEADIDEDSPADSNSTALVPVLREMVVGVGQKGCGFEAQLESWYRFLVDPDPYATLAIVDDVTKPQGTDETLLAQRRDFLRPGSLLAIIVLSDENDCSMSEAGYSYLPSRRSQRMWKPRSECAIDPNDPCCKSCGQQDQGSCPVDPACGDPDQPAVLDEKDDPLDLRCFDQKRRFGYDFLYPLDRYTKALTETTVADRTGALVPNPIFSDLDPTDDLTQVRDQGLVFLAGIVGVPWQDIARDPSDLTKGFKDSTELAAPIASAGDKSTWQVIVGDPATGTPPADPHMIESVDPRSGTNPITGTRIAPPDAASWTDDINGHEHTTAERSELQYACIFELPQSFQRDCETVEGNGGCDCAGDNDSPLCEPGALGRSLQKRAKASPGLRELALIQSIGAQGIVGSVCPKQVDRPGELDYGYRPAIGAIIEKLKTKLGGQCLPRSLKPDEETKQVSCLILEARNAHGACNNCDYPARRAVKPEHEPALRAVLEDPTTQGAGFDCFCEVDQLEGKEGEVCRNEADDEAVQLDGAPIDGWCYIDGTTVPPTGNREIVASCAATEQRMIRFVNKGEVQKGGTLFITCAGE